MEKLTAININSEAVEALDALKPIFEKRLADQGVPINLARSQVVAIALKNELQRESQHDKKGEDVNMRGREDSGRQDTVYSGDQSAV